MNGRSLTGLISKLVAVKSTPDNIREQEKAIDIVRSIVQRETSLIGEIHKFGGRQSFVCRKNGPEKISLIGHLDVVAGPKRLFTPKVVGRRMLGRGVLDMKGPDSAMIIAFTNLIRQNKPIELVLTTDEEIGGTNGVAQLVEKGIINPEIAIIPDGLCDHNVIFAQKGPAHLFIAAKGQSCHASRPWEGASSVDILQKCLIEIQTRFNRARSSQEWLPTITVTRFTSDSAINQVPHVSEACIDVRVTEHEETWRKDIESICDEYNCKIIKQHGDGKVFFQKRNSFISRWKRITRETVGRRPKEEFSCGASDARHLPIGTTAIVTSVEGGGAHSDKEWVKIESLENLRIIIEKFVSESF